MWIQKPMNDVNKAMAYTRKEIEREAFEIYSIAHELFPPGRRHHITHLWKLLDELGSVRRRMERFLPEEAQR